MTPQLLLKIVGIILALILILNLVLAALRKISWITFWVVIVIEAVFAYVVLPRLKKKWE